jgi:hypothetical protein
VFLPLPPAKWADHATKVIAPKIEKAPENSHHGPTHQNCSYHIPDKDQNVNVFFKACHRACFDLIAYKSIFTLVVHESSAFWPMPVWFFGGARSSQNFAL